jgi:DNA-binding NarL/FixJ family response regulator
MFANGHSTKTIATTMGISVKTVEFHKTGIVKTLGLKKASDLTRFALGQGLIQL